MLDLFGTKIDVLGLLIVGGSLLVAAALTWVFARLAGRRLARRRPALGRLASILFVPVLAVALGAWRLRVEAAAYGGDGPPMAFAGTLTLAFLSLAATIPVTTFVLRARA